MILNRNINIHDDREMVEDVAAHQIDSKGLDFSETFWQVHRMYHNLYRGIIKQLVTDREMFNIIDNTIRHDTIEQIFDGIKKLHTKRAA